MDEDSSTAGGAQLRLCLGPGGVGKTTCAAAMALAAADQGRRVVVVTVDPSLRLAQALGLSASTPVGSVVPVLQVGEGRLDALLLDSRSVFDAIIRGCAADQAAAEHMLASPIYAAMAQRLSGALEYAAMACVQMVHETGNYDLIVLDTPPAAHALDFLEAPKRLRSLVESPFVRLLAGTGRAGFQVLGVGRKILEKALGGLVGNAFLSELALFLREFGVILKVFHSRGNRFESLLASPSTRACLICIPATTSVRETAALAEEVRGAGIKIESIILNRVGLRPVDDPEGSAVALGVTTGASPEEVLAWKQALDCHRRSADAADRAAIELEALGVKIRVAQRRVPPPESIEGLREFAKDLGE